MSFDIPTLNAAGQIQSPAVLAQIRKIAEDAARAAVTEMPVLSSGNVLRGPGRPDMPETTEGVIDKEKLRSEDGYAPGTIYVSMDYYDGARLWQSNGPGGWRVLEGETSLDYSIDLQEEGEQLQVELIRYPQFVSVKLYCYGVEGQVYFSESVPVGFQALGIGQTATIPISGSNLDPDGEYIEVEGRADFNYGSSFTIWSGMEDGISKYLSYETLIPANTGGWPHAEEDD